jgi:hydroxymethylglutaryl-CoA synthase
LNSTGEYTQGAGAIAMLVCQNPSIIAFEAAVGVATEGVFDFFKPYQTISTSEFPNDANIFPKNNILEQEISLHREQPVFDGQYSNECYINRISEAYRHFCEKQPSNRKPFEDWKQIWMHLPNAFQGRRTFISIFAENNPDLLAQQVGENDKEKFKNLTKSEAYLNLVNHKIKPSEYVSGMIGNIYTGSIFLGMVGALTHLLNDDNENLVGEKMGFIAYGSGSKSKVFEGLMQENWKKAIAKIQLTDKINIATPVDFETYEKLHKKQLSQPVNQNQKGFVLSRIEKENPNLKGARYYDFLG